VLVSLSSGRIGTWMMVGKAVTCLGERVAAREGSIVDRVIGCFPLVAVDWRTRHDARDRRPRPPSAVGLISGGGVSTCIIFRSILTPIEPADAEPALLADR
jgi:hypothetical protein